MISPNDSTPFDLVRYAATVSGGEGYVFQAPMIMPSADGADAVRQHEDVLRAGARRLLQRQPAYDAARDEVQLDAPGLAHDLQGPSHPTTAFGYLVEGLRRRRSAGVAPFTVLSCDNLHANGDVTGRVVTALASHLDANLGRWIYGQVAFPNSMVDRITPRTTKTDVGIVARLTGLDDAWPVTCEPFSQWVIEDRFPTGRPAWERVGAQLVDDVRPYELMKMRLLNAGHQVLAYRDGYSASGMRTRRAPTPLSVASSSAT